MGTGFNNSFEKAFNPGMAVGSAAALETIKEKIKANEEARQSGLILDSLEARITANAVKESKTPEELSGFTKSFDALRKAKLGAAETLSVAKAIAPDMFKDQSPINVYNVGQNGQLTSAGRVEHGSKVFKQALTADEMASRSEASTRAKEEVQLDYPQLDDKSKSAVSAYKFISPRVQKLNGLIDSGIFGQGGAERLTKQIISTPQGELIVPDGSPLEELVGLYNDIKLTGFNIAGTAFTGTEKETAFALLDPRGKSDKRIKRDLASFQDLFATRVEAGVEGLRGAKETASDIKSKRSGTIDEGYEYKTINGKQMRRKKSG